MKEPSAGCVTYYIYCSMQEDRIRMCRNDQVKLCVGFDGSTVPATTLCRSVKLAGKPILLRSIITNTRTQWEYSASMWVILFFLLILDTERNLRGFIFYGSIKKMKKNTVKKGNERVTRDEYIWAEEVGAPRGKKKAHSLIASGTPGVACSVSACPLVYCLRIYMVGGLCIWLTLLL